MARHRWDIEEHILVKNITAITIPIDILAIGMVCKDGASSQHFGIAPSGFMAHRTEADRPRHPEKDSGDDRRSPPGS